MEKRTTQNTWKVRAWLRLQKLVGWNKYDQLFRSSNCISCHLFDEEYSDHINDNGSAYGHYCCELYEQIPNPTKPFRKRAKQVCQDHSCALETLELAPNTTAYLDNNGGHPGGDEEGIKAGEDVPVDDEDGGEEAEDAAGHEDAGHAAHESPKGAGMHRHPTLQTNELSEGIRKFCN